MKMKMKLLGSVGAVLVTLSATGAVAYADTTPSTTTGARNPYMTQIKTELQQIKSLQGQRRQLNQQLQDDFKSLKGQHLKENDPTDYGEIAATHKQVLGARAKLYTDDAAILLDRQSKDWSKMMTDLQMKETDLQSLVSLKKQQLQNLQNAMAHVGDSGGSLSTQSNA